MVLFIDSLEKSFDLASLAARVGQANGTEHTRAILFCPDRRLLFERDGTNIKYERLASLPPKPRLGAPANAQPRLTIALIRLHPRTYRNNMATENDGPKRRIGVMTSGGDAPGMNGVVRAVVRMSIAKGCDAYAIYEGYEGLVQGGDLIKKMGWDDVRGWLSEGGTLIGTARCPAFRERDGRRRAAKNMILHGIDALVVCGGDGSLTGADKFRSEWPDLLNELVQRGELKQEQVEPHNHLNIVGMVGSIDNDMSLTDATIGCYSSLARICQMVDYIDATASSHQRAFVIEVMGRHCGWLALMSGVSTGADFIFLPERPPPENWEKEMCSVILKVCTSIHRNLFFLT